MTEHSHSQINHDQTEPNSPVVAWSIILSTVFVVGSIWVGMITYKSMLAQEQLVKENVSSPAELKNLHTEENEALTTYKWISEEKNQVQIPLSKAIDKVQARYNRSGQ